MLLGINEVMKGCAPDIVLSGINRGGNLGEDVTYSGTVAAAMEGSLLGFPSIALSQVTDDRRGVKWATAEHWTRRVLERLGKMTFPANVLVNVNFPNAPSQAVTGIEVTRQGRRKIGGDLARGTDPRGDPYFWVGTQRTEDRYRPGTDLEAVTRGAISVTPLSLDLTHKASLKNLKAVFS